MSVSKKILISSVLSAFIVLFSIPTKASIPTKETKELIFTNYTFINEADDDEQVISVAIGDFCTVDSDVDPIGFIIPGSSSSRPLDSSYLMDPFCHGLKCDLDFAIHASKDCSGPIIGSVFATNKGVVSTQSYNSKYVITYDPIPAGGSHQSIYLKMNFSK